MSLITSMADFLFPKVSAADPQNASTQHECGGN